MSLDAGMIFASDSRTNAGVDQISRFSKMRTFVRDGDRVIVMLSSGNLSITQNAINIARAARAHRRRGAQPVERDVDVRRRAPAGRRAARGEDARRPLSRRRTTSTRAPTSSSAGRSAARSRASSTSTAKATSSRRRRRPAISRSARASTASRCSTACSSATRRSSTRRNARSCRSTRRCARTSRSACRSTSWCTKRTRCASGCSGGSRRPIRTSRWFTPSGAPACAGCSRSFPPRTGSSGQRDGHPRRAAAPHHLSIRPARQPVAARDQAASGAALPDAGPRLFAQRRAGQVFPELAAGPVRQLGRAARVHRADRGARHRRRPHRRHDGDQSVRFLRRAVCRALSVRLRAGAREGADPVPRDGAARGRASRPGSSASARRSRPAKRRVDMLVRLNQQLQSEINYLVRMEPGVQAPDDTLERRLRLVPRLGLAARADPASPRDRRALRVGLPDPARRRREAARRTVGTDARFHRPPRVGRMLPAGRRLDRVRPDVGSPRGRGSSAARLHRRSRATRRR